MVLLIGKHLFKARRAIDAASLYRCLGLPVPDHLKDVDIGLGVCEIDVVLLNSDQDKQETSQDETTEVL